MTKLAPGTDRASFFRRYAGPARCASLADFLRYIDASLELLQTRDGLRVAVDDLFAQFARDNVLCAEIRFAPLIHLQQGLTARTSSGPWPTRSARASPAPGSRPG